MNVNNTGSFINHLNSTLTVSNTVTNNGDLVNNSTVTIAGSFTNNRSGTITSGSGGNFNIGGAFANNGRICGPEGLGTGFCLAFQVAGSMVNNGQIATDCNSGATPGGAVTLCSPAPFAQNGSVGTGFTILTGTNVCPCQILTPVTWHNVSARRMQEGILVQWATLREENNLLFRVQRSTDAIRFETIAELKGSRNTEGMRHYQYLDEHITPAAVMYYRIQQEDEDGSTNLSRIVSSWFNDAAPYIYPNPLTGPATGFTIVGLSSSASLSIVSPSGGVLAQLQLEAMQQQVQLPVPLSMGLYIIHITTNAGTSIHKLIVQ